MKATSSVDRKVVERLRKTSSNRWQIPVLAVVAVLMLCTGILGAWAAGEARATMESPEALMAVLQARLERTVHFWGVFTGMVIGAVFAIYYARQKDRLIVAMHERLEALEEKAR